MIEVFAISQTQDPHVESILGYDLTHEICGYREPIKDKRVDTSKNAFCIQFGENTAKRARVEVVFCQRFIHSFCSPRDSAGIDGRCVDCG
jgi:hypothetical protein